MCHAQGPQRSDAGEARTRRPLVLSQALYLWATALPQGDDLSIYVEPEQTADKVSVLLKDTRQWFWWVWN